MATRGRGSDRGSSRGGSDRGGRGSDRGSHRGGSDRGGSFRGGSDRGTDRGRGSDRGGRGYDRGGRGGARGKAETYRPSEGKVIANYFPVIAPTNMVFYQHCLDFGGVDSRTLRSRLCRHFLRHTCAENLALMDSCIFDGTSVFSTSTLPVKGDFVFQLNGSDYSVFVVSVNAIDVGQGECPQLGQAYNIILKKAMGLSLQRIGRNYYCRDEKLILPPEVAKLIRILPGFQTDICYKKIGDQKRLVVNIDTISKVISQENVLTFIQNLQGSGRMTAALKQEIRRELVGTTVFTSYNNNSYVVENIDFGMTPLSTFTMRRRGADKEEQISFWNYCRDMKGCDILCKDQPMLRSSGRNKEKIYLIPETCLRSEFSAQAKEKLPVLCSVKPTDRMARILSLPERLKTNPSANAILDRFKLQISSEPICVRTTSLPAPELFMPGLGTFSASKNWGMESGMKLNFSQKNPPCVTAYVIYETSSSHLASDYASLIANDLTRKGAPRCLKIVPIEIPSRGDHIEGLRKKVPAPAKPCMLISILGEANAKTQYTKIKEWANKYGYVSQCMNAKKQASKADQKGTIVSNIMKQILNKFGQLCWWADISKAAPCLTGRSVMMIGIDVYHNKMRFLEKANVYVQRRSLGAFVAVLVSPNGTYRTSCAIKEVQARREILCKADSDSENSVRSDSGEEKAAAVILECPEITQENNLQAFVARACEEHQFNPDHIIVYRDGVGDSQLPAVRVAEVEQVKKARQTAKLIYVVIQKRIHTRFIVQKPDGSLGNPWPGTCIDQDLVATDYPDFYLIPTRCSLSTVKPVRYVIVHNDAVIPMKEFQNLSFTMCHVYPNWTDSIKLPFPCQLAHKLAYMMGEAQITKPEIHKDLFKTYFYL